MLDGALADLLVLLDLEQTGRGQFLGRSPPDRSRRVYGGQVLAQALVAGQRTCEGLALTARSLHAYFVLPGDPEVPILYQVSTVASGDTTLVNINATQEDRTLFTMAALFARELAAAPNDPMPSVHGPERSLTRRQSLALMRDRAPGQFSDWCDRTTPFETRFIEDIWLPQGVAPRHDTWFRSVGPAPDDVALNQALAVYYSDETVMDNAILPHGGVFVWNDLIMTSLDHAMWFHQPFRVDAWHLFAQDSPIASGGRGLTRGVMWNERGEPVATVAQEILMRRRRA